MQRCDYYYSIKYIFLIFIFLIYLFAEPETQFALVRLHIKEIRQIAEFTYSPIQIFVERNLGFEAEHFQRNLQNEENVTFFIDHKAGRTGVWTTENVKLGAMTMTNVMLREQRICLLNSNQLVSRNPQEARRRLREQLEIYSLQFKTPENAFQICVRTQGLDLGQNFKKSQAGAQTPRARVVTSVICGVRTPGLGTGSAPGFGGSGNSKIGIIFPDSPLGF
jgi:hypothetical protein